MKTTWPIHHDTTLEQKRRKTSTPVGPENPSNNGQQPGTTGRYQINDVDDDGSAKRSPDCSHLDPEVRSSSREDSIKRVYPSGETEKLVRPSTGGTTDRRRNKLPEVAGEVEEAEAQLEAKQGTL